MTTQAVQEEVDIVLGIGGDGTIRMITDGLAGTGIPLGVDPGRYWQLARRTSMDNYEMDGDALGE